MKCDILFILKLTFPELTSTQHLIETLHTMSFIGGVIVFLTVLLTFSDFTYCKSMCTILYYAPLMQSLLSF